MIIIRFKMLKEAFIFENKISDLDAMVILVDK